MTVLLSIELERSTYNVGVLERYGSKDKQKKDNGSASESKYASGAHNSSRKSRRSALYSFRLVMNHSFDERNLVYAHR